MFKALKQWWSGCANCKRTGSIKKEVQWKEDSHCWYQVITHTCSECGYSRSFDGRCDDFR